MIDYLDIINSILDELRDIDVQNIEFDFITDDQRVGRVLVDRMLNDLASIENSKHADDYIKQYAVHAKVKVFETKFEYDIRKYEFLKEKKRLARAMAEI